MSEIYKLHVKIPNNENINIIIHVNSVKIIYIMKQNTKFEDLRCIIENKTKIPKNKQKIIYRGREITENKNLIELKIENDTTLHVIEKIDNNINERDYESIIFI